MTKSDAAKFDARLERCGLVLMNSQDSRDLAMISAMPRTNNMSVSNSFMDIDIVDHHFECYN